VELTQIQPQIYDYHSNVVFLQLMELIAPSTTKKQEIYHGFTGQTENIS